MARFTLITGKMGSGKSAVSKLLRDKHYIVIDSDSEVKSIYNEPEIFCELVKHFPFVLKDGALDMNYIRDTILDEDTADKDYIMSLVIPRLLDKLTTKYEDSKEMIFIEAALTQELGWCVNYLGIKNVIKVNVNEDLRKEWLVNRGVSLEMQDKFDKIQKDKYIIEYWCAGSLLGNNDDLNVYGINNDGTLKDLNDKLIEILMKLGMTHQEKLATYLRYLQEIPFYYPENAWCYSFYNSCGCKGCPFPCKSIDKDWKRLEERDRAEILKKPNAHELPDGTIELSYRYEDGFETKITNTDKKGI